MGAPSVNFDLRRYNDVVRLLIPESTCGKKKVIKVGVARVDVSQASPTNGKTLLLINVGVEFLVGEASGCCSLDTF